MVASRDWAKTGESSICIACFCDIIPPEKGELYILPDTIETGE